MSNQAKQRVFVPYKKLEAEIQEGLFKKYPYGFDKHLVTFKDKKGRFVSALPYETEESYYLVKMSRNQAISIVLQKRLETTS